VGLSVGLIGMPANMRRRVDASPRAFLVRRCGAALRVDRRAATTQELGPPQGEFMFDTLRKF